MQFRLLGPLEVSEHDRVLDLGAGKQRALLAVLLLRRNEIVPTARLIEELWPGPIPRTAGKSVQVYVSGLPKALGEGRLLTRKPGYLLRVESAELDAARFERLVAEARGAEPERAAAQLREALSLWRGGALADLADERFAEPEVARLDGLRVAALEQRIDAELELGRDAELVGELEALVAEHPLRERPRRQLMLALYRAGRQAEALAVYHEVRRTLVEQLGIEPGAGDPLRVRLLARLVCIPTREAGFPAGRKAELSREALQMARRLCDPETLSYALDGYVVAKESPANTREMLASATEQLALATEVGNPERLLEAHEHRHGRLLGLGEIDAARAELAAMAELADQLRQPAQRWLVGASEVRLALLEGRFDDAERRIAEALAEGERSYGWMATATHRLQLYLLRRERDRLGEVEDVVRRSLADDPHNAIWRCVAAHMAVELGRAAEARDAFEALAADDFAALPFEEMWLVGMGFLSDTAAALGDAARAELLYELPLPYAGRIAVSYPEISVGPVDRHLGLLAAITGRWSDADRHFCAAAELSERIGARPWLERMSSAPNWPAPGSAILSIGVMPNLPPVSIWSGPTSASSAAPTSGSCATRS